MGMEVGNIHIGLYVDVGQTARFNDVASVVERSSRRMNTALGNTTTSVRSLRGQMNQSMRFKIAADSLRDLTKTTDEVGRLRAAILGLTALSGAGITGAFTAAYLVQTADKAKLLSNQLRTVTSDFANMGAVQEKLFDISQRTKSNLEATTRIYARAARAGEAFGLSQEKVLTITETVQKAFAIGGATPQEAASAALQLSQGIASDRFGGDEYKSVSENAPVLRDAIAKALKVDIGTLRKMSEEGKLTAKVVTNAILESADQITAAFAIMEPTVAQAFTTLDNAFLRYVGQTDEAYGLTEKLSNAIMGLADNFEEVSKWIGITVGLLGTVYVANKLQQGASSFVGGIRSTNQQIRDSISDMVDERDALQKALNETTSEISARQFRGASSSFDPGALAAQDALNKSKEKEFLAQRRLDELQKARGELVGRLGMAQNAAAVLAQQDVEKARERVRLDQMRVIEAQQAAVAEERILQARREQALTKAGGRVTVAADKVMGANLRVQEADAVIAKERALAKAKLAGEIDSRRQMLVTSSQRLKVVQDQIAELRSVQGLSDFDQAFGGQYRKLLEQQQKAIVSTKATRDEIAKLQEKIGEIDSGASATRGITTAMGRHAAAVKQAQSAVEALAKAEADRQKISATDMTSKTLANRTAIEQKALKQYETSVATLQRKMADLKTATVDALGVGPARKLVSEIDSLDTKIVQAQASLRTASDAVVKAQTTGASQIAASMKAQAKAQDEMNVLQKQAIALADGHAVAVQKIEQAQRRLKVLRRFGGGFLDFFGGGIGFGITAALTAATAAVAYFAAEGAKSAQVSANIRDEMFKLGLVSAETAGQVDLTSASLDNLTVDKRRQKIFEIRKEMERLKGTTGFWEGLFSEDELGTLGDLSGDLTDLIRQKTTRGRGQNKADLPIIRDLKALVDEAIGAKRPIEEIVAELDEIAKKPLSEGMNEMVVRARALFDTLKGSAEYVEKINKSTTTPSGIDMLNRYATTRTTSAENQQNIDRAKEVVVTTLIDEANMNDAEKRIKAIMEEIVKGMDKAGKTINAAAVRSDAERIYANEQTTGAVSGFTDRIIKNESGGRSDARPLNADGTRRSSAYGHGQFLESTWLNLFKKYFPERTATMLEKYGKEAVNGQILALRANSDDSKALIEAYARENAGVLQKAGVSVDEVALQLAHFLGPQGAVKVLTAAPGTAVSGLLSPDAIKANPEVLGGGATVDSVIAYGQKRAGMNTAGTAKLDARDTFNNALGEQQRLIDGLLAEAGIRKTLNPLVNDYGRALSTLEAAQKLLNTAQEEGTAAGVELKNVQQLLKGDFSSLTPEARAQAEAMLSLAQRTGEATASGARLEESQERLKNRLQESSSLGKDVFGGIISDLREGASAGDILSNVFDKLLDKMIEMSLTSIFDGAVPGSGGGILGGLFSPLLGLFGYDGGGWTGPGDKKKAAGVVHADEFVFTKKATQKAGVGNLYALMDYLETGKIGSFLTNDNKPGYETGGFVGRMTMPSFSDGGYVGDNHAMSSMSDRLRSAEPLRVIVESNDEKLRVFVKKEATGVVKEAAPNIVKASINGANQQVVPTMAKYQSTKAGGEWR